MPVFKSKANSAAGRSVNLVRTRAGLASGRAAYEEAVVGFFVESAALLGLPRSVAAIYGICFSSPHPLTFSEVQERLNISAGSISQGLRVLREIGALHSVAGDRGRKEGFEPELGLKRLLLRILKVRLRGHLRTRRKRLEEVRHALPEGTASDLAILETRLEVLSTWHSKAEALLPIISAFFQFS